MSPVKYGQENKELKFPIFYRFPIFAPEKFVTPCFYGSFSMDAMGDDVSVAFSWIEEEGLQRTSIPKLDKFESSIFYWEYSNGVASDVEKIAGGFHSLVRVDSSGTVHLLWVNKKASLVHKAKVKGKWGDDKVLVNNLDVDYGIIGTKCIAAEFDNENKMHVVYPSGGGLVHAVLKVK